LSVGALFSGVRERLPLPGLSFLCACVKFRWVVQLAERYERGVRQRGVAGGTGDRRFRRRDKLQFRILFTKLRITFICSRVSWTSSLYSVSHGT
jgi:hypothetical protein